MLLDRMSKISVRIGFVCQREEAATALEAALHPKHIQIRLVEFQVYKSNMMKAVSMILQ